MTRPLALALFTCLSASACTETPTQIIVAVDTDLSIPDELDGVRIDAVSPRGELRRATGAFGSADALPATVSLLHREGPLEPLTVTASGLLFDRPVLQARAVTEFVEGEARVLRLVLVRACLDQRCNPEETCVDGACESPQRAPGALEPWTGSVARVDAGPRTSPNRDGGDSDGGDSDGCVVAQESCDGADEDCDGEVDETFDLDSDPAHCGACGRRCPSPAGASALCDLGECTIRCLDGFDDCNADERDGCEVSLESPASCGACGARCPPAAPRCQAGPAASQCAAACPEGFGDCDGVGDCETPLDTAMNCGACGETCIDGEECCNGRCLAGSCP